VLSGKLCINIIYFLHPHMISLTNLYLTYFFFIIKGAPSMYWLFCLSFLVMSVIGAEQIVSLKIISLIIFNDWISEAERTPSLKRTSRQACTLWTRPHPSKYFNTVLMRACPRHPFPLSVYLTFYLKYQTLPCTPN